MQLEILPYRGVGRLRFGMTVEQVRRIVPATARPFIKGPGSHHPTDAFDDLGLHVFYRESGKCEAIELAAPARPTLKEKALVAIPFSAVKQFLSGLDSQLEIDESGLTSYSLGLAVYCPGHEEDPTEPVQGVFVFERGYYDAV
jgi:hypothetical protein